MRRLVALACAAAVTPLPPVAASHAGMSCDAGAFAAGPALQGGQSYPQDLWQPPHCGYAPPAGTHQGRISWDPDTNGLVRLESVYPSTFRFDIAVCRVRAGLAVACQGSLGPPVRLVREFSFSYTTPQFEVPVRVELSVGAEATAACHSFTVCAGAYVGSGTFHASF